MAVPRLLVLTVLLFVFVGSLEALNTTTAAGCSLVGTWKNTTAVSTDGLSVDVEFKVSISSSGSISLNADYSIVICDYVIDLEGTYNVQVDTKTNVTTLVVTVSTCAESICGVSGDSSESGSGSTSDGFCAYFPVNSVQNIAISQSADDCSTATFKFQDNAVTLEKSSHLVIIIVAVVIGVLALALVGFLAYRFTRRRNYEAIH